MSSARMCPECREKYWAALDARMPPPPIQIMQIGRPRAEDIESFRRKRADEHYTRIREYQDWLKKNCPGEEHVTAEEEETG